MPAKLLERLERSEDDYRFGAVAVRTDNAALVVITEIPEAEGFSAVNVSELDIDKDGALLRAAGSLSLDQLRVLRGQAPWSVDKVAAAIVRGEFGEDVGDELLDGFRAIFERHAERQPAMAT
ncbi:MAG: hypothetical protein ACREJM_13380 [Candidatus Saccharimonadales bacterium]